MESTKEEELDMENGKRELPPMSQNQFMAHACGAYRGYHYLNNEEAFKFSLLRGYRYFEVDLKMTVDSQLVCSHGWGKNTCEITGMKYRKEFKEMTREMFLRETVHGGMATMDLRRWYQLMKENPDVCCEFDFQTPKHDRMVKMMTVLVETFENDDEVLDRCLIQVNSEDMFRAAESVRHFKYYQYNIKDYIDTLDEVIAFCLENGICAVAINRQYITQEIVDKVRGTGLCLLVFTVDTRDRALNFLRMGANTVCTDIVLPWMPVLPEGYTYILYNSTPEADEDIRELLDRFYRSDARLTMVKSGAYEFRKMAPVAGNRKYRLLKCMYSREGYRLSGWNIRCKLQEKWYWYCADCVWRETKEVSTHGHRLYLVRDKGIVDIEQLYQGTNIIFQAVWRQKKLNLPVHQKLKSFKRKLRALKNR